MHVYKKKEYLSDLHAVMRSNAGVMIFLKKLHIVLFQR